jgi:hypothetical protein
METMTILFIIVILILLYLVIRYYFKSVNSLTTSIMAGTTQQQITSSKLGKSTSGNTSSNFTYSIWFYIDDWNYRYNETKVLFGRMSSPSTGTSAGAGSMPGVSGKDPCPLVSFGTINNNLSVALTCAGDSVDGSGDSAGSVAHTVIHTCSVSNVPIQVWTNLLISVYGRTLDIYLDGKLVNTCLLPGPALVNTTSDVYVTPNGGFSGWTSKLQYFENATDPQTAWDIYRQGYGGSMFSNYNIKVAFMENGNESKSFTL